MVKNEKLFDFIFGLVFLTAYVIFTGFALSINFYEGLIPLVCGLIGGRFI